MASEHAVESGARDFEVTRYLSLGHAVGYLVACCLYLLGTEDLGAAEVLAGCFGLGDAFCLAFTDEGSFKLGDRAEEVHLELSVGVGVAGGVGQVLGDEH